MCSLTQVAPVARKRGRGSVCMPMCSPACANVCTHEIIFLLVCRWACSNTFVYVNIHLIKRKKPCVRGACACIRTVVCVCPVTWIAKPSRADGFIMRKQNDFDNDSQIIILHLKEGERWRRGLGWYRGEGGRRGRNVYAEKGLKVHIWVHHKDKMTAGWLWVSFFGKVFNWNIQVQGPSVHLQAAYPSGSQWQPGQQCSASLSFPGSFHQLLLDAKLFPGQLRDVIPPACPGSASRPPLCQLHLLYSTSYIMLFFFSWNFTTWSCRPVLC